MLTAKFLPCSSEEERLLTLVESDLTKFLRDREFNKVLVFPALEARARFLIHKLVESFPQLQSCSIGQEPSRRTVVHFCERTQDKCSAKQSMSSCSMKKHTLSREPKPRGRGRGRCRKEPEAKQDESPKSSPNASRRPAQTFYTPGAFNKRRHDSRNILNEDQILTASSKFDESPNILHLSQKVVCDGNVKVGRQSKQKPDSNHCKTDDASTSETNGNVKDHNDSISFDVKTADLLEGANDKGDKENKKVTGQNNCKVCNKITFESSSDNDSTDVSQTIIDNSCVASTSIETCRLADSFYTENPNDEETTIEDITVGNYGKTKPYHNTDFHSTEESKMVRNTIECDSYHQFDGKSLEHELILNKSQQPTNAKTIQGFEDSPTHNRGPLHGKGGKFVRKKDDIADSGENSSILFASAESFEKENSSISLDLPCKRGQTSSNVSKEGFEDCVHGTIEPEEFELLSEKEKGSAGDEILVPIIETENSLSLFPRRSPECFAIIPGECKIATTFGSRNSTEGLSRLSDDEQKGSFESEATVAASEIKNEKVEKKKSKRQCKKEEKAKKKEEKLKKKQVKPKSEKSYNAGDGGGYGGDSRGGGDGGNDGGGGGGSGSGSDDGRKVGAKTINTRIIHTKKRRNTEETDVDILALENETTKLSPAIGKMSRGIATRDECVQSNDIKNGESGNEDGNGEGDEDWDTFWDDDGVCLNEELLAELDEKMKTTNVQIVKPQYDYLSFQPKDIILENGVFDHVAEIYDFPAELKTHDLMHALSSFKSQGFEIHWVDDTHALAVFSSGRTAQSAIQECSGPMLKLRPLCEGTQKSKLKARRNIDTLQPYKERPQTTKLIANRLVTGALGMRSKMSKQERQLEREKIKVEREKKHQKEKQKKDLWESDELNN